MFCYDVAEPPVVAYHYPLIDHYEPIQAFLSPLSLVVSGLLTSITPLTPTY